MLLLRRHSGALPHHQPSTWPAFLPSGGGLHLQGPVQDPTSLEEGESPPVVRGESRLASFKQVPQQFSLWFHHKAVLHPAVPWELAVAVSLLESVITSREETCPQLLTQQQT